MKITLKKIFKAFIPYGVIKIYSSIVKLHDLVVMTHKVKKARVESAGWDGNNLSIALYSGEGKIGEFHLKMWVSELKVSKIPFCVITRNKVLFDCCKKQFPDTLVFFAPTARNIEKLLSMLNSLTTILYTSNTGNTIHLLCFNHLKHVFIGHGDSEKCASAYKFFRAYDEIWGAGQAQIDRFNNAFDTGHLRFVKIGRPQRLDTIQACSARWQERLPVPTALYLPTWEGVQQRQEYSSLLMAEQIIQVLNSIFGENVYCKLHPATGRDNHNYARIETVLKGTESIQYLPKQNPAGHDVLIKANIFICDISSVVTDCLAANAPLFVYLPSRDGLQMAESKMPFTMFAYTWQTVEELETKLKEVLAGNDSLASARLEAMEYYLGRSYIENNEFHKQLHLAATQVLN
jgi:hypothetical protein